MIYHVRMSLEQSVLIALHTHQAVLLKSRGRWHDVAGWHQLHHQQQQPLLVSRAESSARAGRAPSARSGALRADWPQTSVGPSSSGVSCGK